MKTGWTSSDVTIAQCGRPALSFNSREQAEAFARRQGWAYEVSRPETPRPLRQRRFAGYGDNFTVRRSGIPDMSHFPASRDDEAESGGGGGSNGGKGGSKRGGKRGGKGGGGGGEEAHGGRA